MITRGRDEFFATVITGGPLRIVREQIGNGSHFILNGKVLIQFWPTVFPAAPASWDRQAALLSV